VAKTLGNIMLLSYGIWKLQIEDTDLPKDCWVIDMHLDCISEKIITA